ncbi:Mfa1 family fimbria major subunit [Alistipes communis]|jgi:lipoprotein|uniref:Mfa1 family fimbria major subunit n=1 Tax=Alistipes communis TaxID=2585118 RepID=UPI003AB5C3BA
MKTLNILTTGAFATLLLLGSCTKDVDNPNSPGGGGEGGVVEGIPTYATVSLSQRTGAGTYVGPEDDYVNETSQATEVEKKITDAVVLVFNSDDVLENYVKFEDAELATAPYAKTFATTTGKKRLYALANLENYSKIEAIFNGQTAADKKLSNVCKVIQQITDISGATTDNKFWMSNVYKLGATIEDQVTVQKGDENTNNFTIYIGRMVSKVTPKFADNLVINSGDGTIEKDEHNTVVAEYRVRNNPNRFFSFPVYNAAGLLTSPYYDRNYTDGGSYDADGLGAGDFFDNGTAAAFGKTMGQDSYLTENSPKEAKRHKVTFLSIKAKWTPSKDALFLNADGTVAGDLSGTIAGNGGTFYRVQKWENGKIVGYCPGIYATTPTRWTDVGGTPGNTAPQETPAVADRNAAKASATPCYLIVTYDQGMAYWAYWMRSRLDGTIAEKYALKRNNHYKVNIISVDGVGEPTEDDNLDKDEDLEADASMKATIEVLNWNVVDIEGGI